MFRQLMCTECDQCRARGPHGDTLQQAMDNARADGWQIVPSGELCPACARGSQLSGRSDPDEVQKAARKGFYGSEEKKE